jgi:hypothetical protein
MNASADEVGHASAAVTERHADVRWVIWLSQEDEEMQEAEDTQVGGEIPDRRHQY